mgnify:CR=1 FL=1
MFAKLKRNHIHKMEKAEEGRTPNQLIHESSPYLLQHAYNPVKWHPWSESILKKAQEDDKPILVSIGYSACHWCHVMEHESFEDEEVATIMNRDYICIKVDREERPDVDQIYMDALQTMGLQGGWPLNVFLMPNAKPFYGGTYFRKHQWQNLLLQIGKAFREQREELDKSANGFADALNRNLLEKYGLQQEVPRALDPNNVIQATNGLLGKIDPEFGGEKGAPKFPMPVLYEFLLSFAEQFNHPMAKNHVHNTLTKMAYGGIYDQVGGGFARYSVDGEWFAPHFEKMLYDNAQLISLYSRAYRYNPQSLYKEVVEESIEFVFRELTNEEKGFYSALDADSEGEEGKFYTWKFTEIVKLFADDLELFEDFYNVKMYGNWENDQNILFRKQSKEAFAKKHNIEVKELEQKVAGWKKTLFEERSQKVRPGLDDKTLTSWNGLMITALADAYITFNNPTYLEHAQQSMKFIMNKLKKGKALMHNYKKGTASIKAYLEDYAAIIQACLSLYNACFDEQYLKEAKLLSDYCLENFYDEEENLFFFTDKDGEQLIARKKEIFDSVIPSSNALMAHSLYELGSILGSETYTETSKKMLFTLLPLVEKEPRFLSHWTSLYLKMLHPQIEIAIVGKDHLSYSKEIQQHFLPNIIINACEEKSDLPLLQQREAIDGKTTIYVCQNRACKLPVHSVKEALELV